MRKRAAMVPVSVVPICMMLGLVAGHAAGAGTDGDPSPNLASASSGPLFCEIVVTREPGSVHLGTRLTATMPFTGEGRLTVAKAGSGGTSNIAQNDRFSVDADRPQALGTMRIGLEPGAHLSATLAVRTDSGLECRVATSLEGRAR